jgi:hypothetical protein
VDLDWKCEDWDSERDQCVRCTERDEEELNKQHEAAQAAEDEQ